ncbi:hypothetical protein DK847_07495 [Aestuariivirga litoralis]|uniref:Uncharacterized protein n=1 Tax=Aestuariivirga litoralis TaxID=2650924 RepID=A0A2W2BUK7_9HYPH|nr:hypothetical protein DK847_07495 [Aestuariivirga litoralis]
MGVAPGDGCLKPGSGITPTPSPPHKGEGNRHDNHRGGHNGTGSSGDRRQPWHRGGDFEGAEGGGIQGGRQLCRQ